MAGSGFMLTSLGCLPSKLEIAPAPVVLEGLQEYLCSVILTPSSSRHHLSNDNCLKDKRENYQNCSVLRCFCVVCYFFVRFSFFSTMARKAVLSRVGRKTLTQSINQSVCDTDV